MLLLCHAGLHPRSDASELGKGAPDGEAIVDTQGSPV